MVYREGSVAFLKLYLMPYKQFENLVCCTTGCLPFKFQGDAFTKGNYSFLTNTILGELYNLSYVSEDCPFFYNSLTKLGTLEHLDILCLTHDVQFPDFDLVTPTIPVMRRLFDSYKHAFFNYTEHFILYYLYRRDQVREAYSMQDLLQIILPNEMYIQKNDMQSTIPCNN